MDIFRDHDKETPPNRIERCQQWPECGCISGHSKASCTNITHRQSRGTHGAAIIVPIATAFALAFAYGLTQLAALTIGMLP